MEMCARTQSMLTAKRLVTMVFVLTVLLAGSTCGPKNPIGEERGGLAKQSSPLGTPSTTTASTGNKIGVPECDDFIAKYEACVTGKVPEAARASYQTAVKQWKDSWKKLAENPQTKGTLAAACKQAREQQETALKSYGCTW